MTKQERNELSKQLHSLSLVMETALDMQAQGNLMPVSKLTPEEALRNIAHSLWVISQELKGV